MNPFRNKHHIMWHLDDAIYLGELSPLLIFRADIIGEVVVYFKKSQHFTNQVFEFWFKDTYLKFIDLDENLKKKAFILLMKKSFQKKKKINFCHETCLGKPRHSS